MIESSAKLRHVRISPKKARLVADAIRGLDVVDALDKLPVIFKKSSPLIEKLLRSATANMFDKYNLKAEDLKIKSIFVNKGKDLKRFSPAAFGRAHPFYKHSCHIEIILAAKEGVKPVLKEKVVSEIETVDLTKVKKDKDKEEDSKETKAKKKDKKEVIKKEENKKDAKKK